MTFATYASISSAQSNNLRNVLARLEIEQPKAIQRHMGFNGKHRYYRINLEVLDAAKAKKVSGGLKWRIQDKTGHTLPLCFTTFNTHQLALVTLSLFFRQRFQQILSIRNNA
jgi:hypothetical protein